MVRLAAPSDVVLRQMAASKARLIAGLLATVTALAFAEKTAELNDDFIEYLGQMESNDEDWSDFADDVRTKEDEVVTCTSTYSQQSSVASAASTRSRDDGKQLSRRSGR